MNTPWGKSDSTTKVMRGLSFVTTPSHGGFMITRKLASEILSQAAILEGRICGQYLAYEEDCDAEVILWEVKKARDLTPSHSEEQIRRSLSAWHVPYLVAVNVIPLEPEWTHYQERQEEDRLRREHGPIIICAWGDWKDGVPKGHVKVELANGHSYILTSEDYAQHIAVKTIDKYPSAVAA